MPLFKRTKSWRQKFWFWFPIGLFVGGAFFFTLFYFLWLPRYFSTDYDNLTVAAAKEPAEPTVSHIQTPDPVKAVYLTGWTAGSKKRRDEIVKMIESTELNSVVIDVKDYSGRISFEVNDPALKKIGASERRIADIDSFIQELHSKGIYVIGRISVFQDAYMVKRRPDLAVKKLSDKTAPWKDYKGVSWLDAGAPEVWDYIVAIGKEAYSRGFDELNFDYIRFPSDGNMSDIHYPWDEGRQKSEVLRNFFSHLRKELSVTGAVLSADLFGMTTTNADDLNIGQILEKTLPYFDYVSPMVYPSHYPPRFMGFPNPAAKPYEVIYYSMDKAVARASTTPWKLRPWLQDFNLGANYNADMIKAEIKAVYDVGLNSWMLWNPSNYYTVGALGAKNGI
jgi:hypothetical protein